MRSFAGAAMLCGVVMAMVPHPAAPVLGLVIAVAAGLVLDRAAIQAVARAAIIVALLAGAVIAGVLVGWMDGSTRGVAVGLTVLTRMAVLVLAGAVVSRQVDADRLLHVTRRLGMERLGLVLGLSLNALPRVADAIGEAVTAMRIRRRARSLRLSHVSGFIEVVLAHTARVADEAAAAAALRGYRSLGRPELDVRIPTKVVVVTGPTGCGKTSTVETVVSGLRERGLRVTGFIQPGVWRDGKKVGFEVRDVATGEHTDLAHRSEGRGAVPGTGYQFFRGGFDLARRALNRWRAGDVVVVDELGPLELRGRGHMPAVRRSLADGGAHVVVLVVRRHLVPSLLSALDAEDATLVDVESLGGDAARRVLQALQGGGAFERARRR